MEIKVLISPDSFSCPKCNRDFLVGDLKYYNGSEYICLGCAELDYLIYLPSGNHCLTRRAQKYSKVSANVYRQNKSKHRYERKGTLVEKNALSTAEKECEKDSNYREEHRGKAKVYRDKKELQYRNNFAKKIRNLFPCCPKNEEFEIAEHACEISSGRVGRSIYAKNLRDSEVRNAVIAHIRHSYTNYDELLWKEEFEKELARDHIRNELNSILRKWECS